MALIIACPKCQNKHRLADDALARELKFKCKKCGHHLTVAARPPKKVVKNEVIEEAEEAEVAEEAEEAEEIETKPAKGSGKDKKRGKKRKRDDASGSKLPFIIGGGVVAVLIVVGVLVVMLSGRGGRQQQVAFTPPPPTPVKKDVPEPKASTTPESDITKALGPAPDAPKEAPKEVAKEPAKDEPKDVAQNPPMDLPPKDVAVAEGPKSSIKLREPPTEPAVPKMPGTVAAMVFSPGGDKAVVLCNGDAATQSLTIVEIPSGKIVTTVPLTEVVNAMALRPDGRFLVLSGPSAKAPHRELDLATGKLSRVFQPAGDIAQALAISSDGDTLVIAERGNGTAPASALRAFNLKSNKQIFAQPNTGRTYVRMLFAQDNKSIFVFYRAPANRIAVVNIVTGMEDSAIQNVPPSAVDMALSNDGKLLALALNTDSKVSIRDVATGAEKRSIEYGGRIPASVVFGPNDKTIIVAYQGLGVRVFEVENGAEVGGLDNANTPTNLMLSPGGNHVTYGTLRDLNILDFPGSLRKVSPGSAPVGVARIDPVQPPTGQINPQPVPGFIDPNLPFDPNRPFDPSQPWNALRFGHLRLGRGIFGNPNILLPGFVPGQQQPGQPPLPPQPSPPLKAKIEMRPSPDQFVMKVQNQLQPFQTVPTTQFLDAAGAVVGADQAGKILRVGNTVTIRVNLNDKALPIIDVRLNEEGPRERNVLEATCKSAAVNEFVTFTIGAETLVQFVRADAKLENHAGKASAEGAKFFRPGGKYSFKVRAEEDSKVPELVEAKELKAVEWADYPGGKIVKNAVVAQMKDDGFVTMYLIPAGGKQIRLAASNKEARAEDATGKIIPIAEALKVGNRVDALLGPLPLRSAAHPVVEIKVISVAKTK